MAGNGTRLNDQLIAAIVDRVAADRRVRRTLPPHGRIHIDRQLPFLFVVRPAGTRPDPSVAALVTGEASYLVSPAAPRAQAWTRRLVKAVAAELSNTFGGFLVVELWAGPLPAGDDPAGTRPSFRIVHARRDEGRPGIERLGAALSLITVRQRRAVVTVSAGARLSSPGNQPLLTAAEARDLDVHLLGVEVGPVFRDPETGAEFPLVRQALARQVGMALRQAAFEFSVHETNHRPLHYHALGRRAFVKAVSEVDARLRAVAESFDLLLAVTPTNADAAFRAFRRSGYSTTPRLTYRPLSVDPSLLKRDLFNIPIERVEDASLDSIFREKRRELDLKLTLLEERNRPRFLPTATALYGPVDEDLLATARSLLERLPRGEGRPGRSVDAAAFAARAEAEIARYRSADGKIGATVTVRRDVSSLMVSAGHLLVGAGMSFPVQRVEPLLQHEVGTHVVTYWNGAAQPFKLLATGLAAHDQLQEGLGVFAEYLVGGLTPGRLRVLAARVVAAQSVVGGAEFAETFRMLRDEFGLSARSSFLISLRVHRGGGFTKDAVYLSGLRKIVDYLAAGGRVDTLLVGKIAAEHAPVVEELQRRRVLVPPPYRPSYLDDPDSHYRIERLRRGVDLSELVEV